MLEDCAIVELYWQRSEEAIRETARKYGAYCRTIIRNILGQLKAAGLVTVKAGEGGTSLTKKPEQITLLDIFDAVEKEEALFHFHENPNPTCPVGKNVHAVLDSRLLAIQEAMREQMRSVTLQDLLDDMDRLSDGSQL